MGSPITSAKTGFNIKVTCSQDATLILKCKSKKMPGFKLADKVDVTTDQTTKTKAYLPGDLPETTDSSLTTILDYADMNKVLAIIGQQGTITFTDSFTGYKVTCANAWFASYEPNDANLTANPEATITIQFAGGETGTPVAAVTGA